MTLRNNVKSTTIPDYSRKQEISNFISHVIGIPVALFILGYGIFLSRHSTMTTFDLLGVIFFAISAFTVYFVSSVYHFADNTCSKKKLLRVLDHCVIYLLIAGTYTPICIKLIEESSSFGIGLFMLIFQWVGAIIGISLNAFFFHNKAARIISFILYVLMGWLALFCGSFLYIQFKVFGFILVGGIVYTIGSILYAIGHDLKWFHFVFHIFVLLGTIIQTIGVFFLY